jgi:hypothetical protein
MYRKQENKEPSKDRILSNKWFCYITVDSETHLHQKIILSFLDLIFIGNPIQ